MKQLYGLVGRQVVLVIILIFTISEIYGQGADKKDTVKLEQNDTFEIIKWITQHTSNISNKTDKDMYIYHT